MGRMKIITFLIISVLVSSLLQAQQNYSQYGKIYRLKMHNSLFPDSTRADGHTYKDQFYSREEHYSDSTVLVFVPKYFSADGITDFVVYFHGWNNNVDSVLAQFKLIEQFFESGKKAVLVMPEGPKNAPDSFGGKFEEKGTFNKFITELTDSLKLASGKTCNPGNIILAGHSGAYRVIAYILMRGGITDRIQEVYLFDALYADVEKYSYWLDHYDGKLINIFTPNGGTKGESENLMECLDAWNLSYKLIDDDGLTIERMRNSRIIFISSKLEHNDIISSCDQFKIFLQSSGLR